ncbi:class I SAM-dependent methyltransferase [Kribbella ginsengisoli]|uniref:Class I SAM-dependent methyltransferase n=2 Tax=Kribbella ginsengisoli TaxID=363865 RepID=A0ABP6Z9F8_9ACTN
MSVTPPADLTALKAKQQATWASGNYSVIGTTLQVTGETLCDAVDFSAGQLVLDVAAGNGNAALAAARRGAVVTATDYVPGLLDVAKTRALADGVEIESQVADAEALPFDAQSFDVVLSTFGVMFTPDQEQAASELRRVCRKGGKIGFTAWTPDSFIGQMFKIVGTYIAPPAGVRSPLLWGDESRVAELFHDDASMQTERLDFFFRYRSARHWLDTMRSYYGPTNKAFAALDGEALQALDEDLIGLANDLNTATDGTLRVPSTYLQTIVTRS